MERLGTNYLEGRKLIKRWPGPIPAIVTLIFTCALFYGTWWIFQDPRGWLRFYTPFKGYKYAIWWLLAIIWMVYLFNFWPFRRSWLEKASPLLKGAVLTVVSVGVLLVFVKIFFEGILGHLGLAYFSPGRVMAMKLPYLTEFFAIEYASFASLMFATIAIWLSPSWVVACEESPWQELKQPAKGVSIFVMTFLLSTIVYFVTAHSHMGILSYPWEYFTSIAPPWWEKFAHTVSGNFHVSWILCCVATLWVIETIWERYPFKLIKNNRARRLTAFFGIIIIAFIMSFFLYFAQELTWGPVIRGTRRDFAPDWRWLHVGEMAILFLVPALFIKFYMNNWPRKFSIPVNILIRTIIMVIVGTLLYFGYYRYSYHFLGTQKGFSHPQQFPLIPIIWLICFWLVNHWFMDNWPGWKMVPKTEEEIARSREEEEKKIKDIKWSPTLGWGLGVGAVIGVALYFVIIWLLPILHESITIIK